MDNLFKKTNIKNPLTDLNLMRLYLLIIVLMRFRLGGLVKIKN